MDAATVTIGRNIGDTPMPERDWTAFRTAVRNAMQRDGVDVVADTDYRGSWEGVSEDAHLFYGLVPDWRSPYVVTDDLVAIRRRFHQDAIGVAVAPVDLR